MWLTPAVTASSRKAMCSRVFVSRFVPSPLRPTSMSASLNVVFACGISDLSRCHLGPASCAPEGYQAGENPWYGSRMSIVVRERPHEVGGYAGRRRRVQAKKARARDEGDRDEQQPGVAPSPRGDMDGIAEDDRRQRRREHEPEVCGVALPALVRPRLREQDGEEDGREDGSEEPRRHPGQGHGAALLSGLAPRGRPRARSARGSPGGPCPCARAGRFATPASRSRAASRSRPPPPGTATTRTR